MNAQWIRNRCLALPGVTEDLKWEKDLCFLVGGRMFCILVLDGPFRASIKVGPVIYDDLLETPDIVPAPYLARHKWVEVHRLERFALNEWDTLLARSHELVFNSLPARTKRSLMQPGGKP